MFEQSDHPYDCKAFQFGAPIVGLLLVGSSACISYHMVLFIRSFLCKDCSKAILGCISIQDERFLQTGWTRIGAEVRQCCNFRKASSCSSFHSNGTPFFSKIRIGEEISANLL